MKQWEFKLLYDGQCPFCRREVNWLQRRDRQGRLAVEDISAPDFAASNYGLTQAEVMGVMHGVFPDGQIVRKVAAFREAYRVVGLGWLLAPTVGPGCAGWPTAFTNGSPGTASPSEATLAGPPAKQEPAPCSRPRRLARPRGTIEAAIIELQPLIIAD